MRLNLRLLIRLLRRSTRARRDLLLESLVLRQQLAVYGRRPKRSRLRNEERLFWLVVARILQGAGVPAGIVATAETCTTMRIRTRETWSLLSTKRRRGASTCT